MEPDTPVTISPMQQQAVDAPVYLADDTAPQLAPKPEVAAKRAEKASLGLSKDLSMSPQDIRAQIQSGQEEMFRQSAASNLNYQKAMAFDQKLINARNQKGAALT